MRVAVSFVAAALLGGPAIAAELRPESRIDSVVLHPDGAVVTRIAGIEMPAGANTVMLRGLPASLDASSIRVEGAGDATFVIVGVDVRSRPGEPDPAIDRGLEEKIEALRDEAERIAGRIEAFDRKKAAIQVYAEASPAKLSPEAEPLDVSQWAAAWEAIGNGMLRVNEDLRVARDRAGDLRKEIAALEAARQKPVAAGKPVTDLSIALQAAGTVNGSLSVSYRVGGARWTPLYDARLATGDTGVKPSLTLVRRASLSQRTGEDWNNVRLSVSTVDTRQGTEAPEVEAVRARLEAKRTSASDSAGRRTFSGAPAAAPEPAAEIASTTRPVPPAPAPEQSARIEATGFTVVFAVPGRVSVPADGSKKTFLISSSSFEPSLRIESAPLLDASAYIQASFVLDDEAPIFPGEVTLQRDGVLVGTGSLDLVAPGAEVELGFGVDDRVEITRTPLHRERSEPGLFGSDKSDVQQFRTVVRNRHEYPVAVRIVDRLPYSEDESVQVAMTPESSPPSEKNIDDRRGVMQWDVEVPAGGEKEIRFGYSVTWPADRRLVVR